MREITFCGWQVGMRKGAFTQLLRAGAKLSLNEVHALMLREQPVAMHVPDALGVKCRPEPLPPPARPSTRPPHEH